MPRRTWPQTSLTTRLIPLATTLLLLAFILTGLGPPQTLAQTFVQDDAQPQPPMTLDRLERIIAAVSENIQGVPGAIQFEIDGLPMACISDPAHDRMRIIAAVAEERTLTKKQYLAMMEANFHTALDARYATSGGVLYAAFIHPLSPLEDRQVLSALSQVVNLKKTFGTTYSSTDLKFGGTTPRPDSTPSPDPNQ